MTNKTRTDREWRIHGTPFGLFRWIILGGVLAWTGCQNFAPPNQSWTVARVEGRVVDERTREPLGEVNIWRVRAPEIGDGYAVDKGGKQMQNRPTIATSGPDGQFTLAGERTASLFWQTFPDFSVTLRFQRTGYATIERRYTNVVLGTTQNKSEPVIQTGDVPLTPR